MSEAPQKPRTMTNAQLTAVVIIIFGIELLLGITFGTNPVLDAAAYSAPNAPTVSLTP